MILAALITGVVLLSPSAQTGQQIHVPERGDWWDTRDVTVKSIRRVVKSGKLRGDPGIEIELFSPHPLYVGGMEWVLRVATIYVQWPVRQPYKGGETLTYTVSIADWKNLKNGDELSLGWPARGSGFFGHLNKKMLAKH
jgi:hypothetical protein